MTKTFFIVFDYLMDRGAGRTEFFKMEGKPGLVYLCCLSFDYFSVNILFDKIIFRAFPQRYLVILDIHQFIIERSDMKDIDDIRLAKLTG
jgi:hypothetical protein